MLDGFFHGEVYKLTNLMEPGPEIPEMVRGADARHNLVNGEIQRRATIDRNGRPIGMAREKRFGTEEACAGTRGANHAPLDLCVVQPDPELRSADRGANILRRDVCLMKQEHCTSRLR